MGNQATLGHKRGVVASAQHGGLLAQKTSGRRQGQRPCCVWRPGHRWRRPAAAAAATPFMRGRLRVEGTKSTNRETRYTGRNRHHPTRPATQANAGGPRGPVSRWNTAFGALLPRGPLPPRLHHPIASGPLLRVKSPTERATHRPSQAKSSEVRIISEGGGGAVRALADPSPPAHIRKLFLRRKKRFM